MYFTAVKRKNDYAPFRYTLAASPFVKREAPSYLTNYVILTPGLTYYYTVIDSKEFVAAAATEPAVIPATELIMNSLRS